MKLWEVNKLQLLKILTSHFVSNPQVGEKSKAVWFSFYLLLLPKGLMMQGPVKVMKGWQRKKEVRNYRQNTFTY